MAKKINLIILGPQGSGKGSQAEKLSQKYEIPIFSTGDLIRVLAKKSNQLGKTLKNYSQSGKLVPLNLIEKILNLELKKSKYQNGVIFDGIPRDIKQAEILTKIFEKFHLPSPRVIFLKIKRSTSLKRLISRRICPKCKSIFNLKTLDQKLNICPKCRLKVVQRSDDKPDVVAKRLAIYFQKTQKVIDFYQKRGRLIEVDGEPDIDRVYKDIIQKLANEQ